MPEEAPDVVGERGHGGIPFRCLFLQRFRDDRVEIAAKHALQPGRCRAAPTGMRSVRRLALADHVGRPPRLQLHDRAHQCRGRVNVGAGGMRTGEQHVQQHAEGVHVGCRRNRATRELFRCRVLGRCRPGVPCQRRGVGRCDAVPLAFVALDQLGDAEVEQLDVTGDADHDVAGLDIPVHDQVGMRVSDGLEHVEKQAQAGLDTECVLVAVAVDGLPVHVLEHEVRLAAR